MPLPITLVWLIAATAVIGIIARPKKWPEAIWACSGAALIVGCGLLPLAQAAKAVAKGTDVYLFLAGMMMLSELARQEGVFDWLASLAVVAAKGSPVCLFTLVYGVGIAVTVFLSNDATAVVLTPAVYVAVQKARTKALPCLLVCAFIANAASFVLPISNPANLVVFGKTLPRLSAWLRTFFLPSFCSIIATYAILRWNCRHDLIGRFEPLSQSVVLSKQGRLALWGIAAIGAVLIITSGFGFDLGLPTCVSAVIAVLAVTRGKVRSLREIGKGVSWSVLPLVAGLFVLVEAVNRAGALNIVAKLLSWCQANPSFGSLAASFSVAALSNLINNLPSGLLVGGTLQSIPLSAHIRNSVLIGVDLGPSLSVTGSLATILWLLALRREGEHISGWQFLKVGLLVMPPALLLATLASQTAILIR